MYRRYYSEPTPNTNKAIPLCLPNNFVWDPRTGEIRKSRGGRRLLYVVDAAVAELRKIRDPVCVVAIAGPCRDGKSFILSEVFGQPDVFPVGFKMDPETMGIWMWILPFKIQDHSGREFSVVLLDSEGTDAPTAKEKQDDQIFIMTVLLSSVLIYNSKGVPKRNDLHELDFVAKLSDQIKATSTSGTGVSYNTFPFFIWLLRDVMNDLPDDCTDIRDFFFKRIFKGTDGFKVDSNQKIADSILHFFSGFDAFCLPPPTYNKDVMKDIARNRSRMNPEFFTGVKEFEQLLKTYMGPKESLNEGEYVTGEALASLVRIYLNAINDPRRVPDMLSAWKTYVHGKCQEAKEKALGAYHKKMASDLSKLPCDDTKILTSHRRAIDLGMKAFCKETDTIASKHTEKDCERFVNQANEKLCEWKNKNDRLTRESCEKLLKELKGKYLDPVLARLLKKDESKETRAGSTSFFTTNSSHTRISDKWRMLVDGEPTETCLGSQSFFTSKSQNSSRLDRRFRPVNTKSTKTCLGSASFFIPKTLNSTRLDRRLRPETIPGATWCSYVGVRTRVCYREIDDNEEEEATSGAAWCSYVDLRKQDRTSVSYREIDDACTNIERDYKSQAIGSSNVIAQVFLEFNERLKDEIDQYKEILILKDYSEALIQERQEKAKKEKEVARLEERRKYLEMERKIQEQRLKDFDRKKRKELEDELKQLQINEEVLQKKTDALEKAGMSVATLKAELNKCREEQRKRQSQIQDLKNQIASLAEQLRRANRPWYKKLFGID